MKLIENMVKNEIIEKNVKSYLETKENRYFTPIFENLHKPLLNFILQKINDYNEANEVLSNALEKIYLGLRDDKYKKTNNIMFSTWAHTVTKNAMLYYFREHKKFTPYADEYFVSKNLHNEIENPDDYEYNLVQFTKAIKYEIENLDDPILRKIGIDFYLKNKKIKEIAPEFGKHLSYVKIRLMKIRKILNEKYGDFLPKR